MRPEHLLEQADHLLAIPRKGPLRQADKGRAVSAAYYALFHMTLSAMADLMIGRGERGSDRYVLAYRSVDHRRLRAVCEMSLRSARPLDPSAGAYLHAFASTVLELGELRNRAEYDPSFRIDLRSAQQAVIDARAAILSFDAMGDEQRRMFLTLVAFPRRA